MRFTQPEFYLKTRDEMLKRCSVRWKRRSIAPGTSRSAATVSLEKVKEAVSQSSMFPLNIPLTSSLFRICSPVRQGFEKAAGAPGGAARKEGGLKARSCPEYARAAGSRGPHDPADEVFSGYFLIVWDFIRFGEIARDSRGPWPCDRRPAAWSVTPWRSPTSIRWNMVCCLSASRIRSASACPISISTSLHAPARRGNPIRYREVWARAKWRRSSHSAHWGARTAIKDVGRALDIPFGGCRPDHKAHSNHAQHQAERGDAAGASASKMRPARILAWKKKCWKWRAKSKGWPRQTPECTRRAL